VSVTMMVPTITTHEGPHTDMPKVNRVRAGFSVSRLILAQSDLVFEARNESRTELLLRAIRACIAGKWEPDLARKLPVGNTNVVQMRLRPEDDGPYRAWCDQRQYPYSLPIAHALWLYATTPDPKDLPF
jgi:hypothetical protein